MAAPIDGEEPVGMDGVKSASATNLKGGVDGMQPEEALPSEAKNGVDAFALPEVGDTARSSIDHGKPNDGAVLTNGVEHDV